MSNQTTYSPLQLDIFQARVERDAGIAKAVFHANLIEPSWSENAYRLLEKFISLYPKQFMAEEFRSWCEQQDFPQPPHNRAFGGVIKRAATAGLIRKVGFAQVKNVKAHMANAAVWVPVK